MKGRLLAMKKSIILTALVLAALLVLVGCAGTPKIENLINDALKGKGDGLSDIIDGIGDSIGGSIGDSIGDITGGIVKGNTDIGIDNSIQGIYTNFQDAKGKLVHKITTAINAYPESGISTGLSVANVFEVDMAMWPDFLLWDTEQAVMATGSFFGMSNFEITRSKNHAVMSYTADNGSSVIFTADYDEVKGHYRFQSESENGDHPTMEVIRTPYGMAGQSYMGGIGMLENLYLFSIEGEKGIVGVIRDTEAPAPLTGQETFDFPMKAAAEWYHFEDGHLTGVDRNGTTVDLIVP